MKNIKRRMPDFIRKYILFFALLPLLLLCISASRTTSWVMPVSSDEYFNSVMQSFFGQVDNSILNMRPNTFPDTSLHYPADAINRYTNEPACITLFARRQCDVSPSEIYYAFYIPLDTNAYWNAESFSYNSDVRARFKNMFGKDILKGQIALPARKGAEPGVFRFFRGKAFLAAFKILYKKPDSKFKGLVLQKVYDVTLKDYCRDAADIVSKVLSDKKLFKQCAKNYLAKAKTDTNFDGVAYTDRIGDTLTGKAFYQKLSCCTSGNRILGIMLRRKIDGSLPKLLTCFKILLKDYDPDYYIKIKSNF